VAGGAPTIAAETRAELDRLSTVLGYVAEARDRLNILCDDLVSAIVQVARSDNPEVGKKVRDWARLLEDTARMLLIAGKLVKEYWS
jgi:ABC-type transporter Mla subunit MlaD